MESVRMKCDSNQSSRALVEDNLQASKSDRNESQTDVVNLRFAKLAAAQVRGILNQTASQQQGQNTDGNIYEENPSPSVVVCDPAAKRWTDRRSHDYGDAIDRERHAALRRRESIRKNRLFARLQSATAGTLQNPEDD